MAAEHYLVCYDISSRTVRYRVEKELLGYGERVQYSVFECLLTFEQFQTLRHDIRQWLEDGDRVNYFRLCIHCLRRRITQGAMVAWQASHFEIIDG
ncbi:CRISPR-associated endonuclease Cas2 [Vibrio mexicanus]|uniref:CRISPR-associated endonuclease Cas2 n=1 Tax=Vibrio mexicanus TaxID=1004326 RepID=UPI0009499752|nr:CRISPR-associated endonuclease Cas2 [Vibrio mexicanus]